MPIFFFAGCCLSRSRAEHPSVSECKVKITAYASWPSHHVKNCKQINQNMHQRQRRTKRSKEAFTATTKSRRRPDSTRKRRGTGKKKGFVEKWRVFGCIPQTGDRRDKGKQSHYEIKLQRIWPCRKLKQKWEKTSPFATESENSQACPKLGDPKQLKQVGALETKRRTPLWVLSQVLSGHHARR